MRYSVDGAETVKYEVKVSHWTSDLSCFLNFPKSKILTKSDGDQFEISDLGTSGTLSSQQVSFV